MVEAATLSQRYRLQERIAGGGMGTVYAAVDERLDRRVAVKMLKEELVDDPHFVERFRREARAVAALLHANIASVFDYGEDELRPYIVMELVEGRDLARLLREEGTLAHRRAVAIGAQVCDALGHAHRGGLVHRDVKPANVIVGPADHVKVTDFGIARVAGDSTLTAVGSVLGTAQYISPEQASDATVGPPSDVYSTGVMLYEMLTGALPFTGDSPVALAIRHLSDDVPAPSRTNPDIPSHLDDVVLRATAKRPEDRFADGDEMAAALRGEPAPTAVMGAAAGAAGAAAAAGVTQPITPVDRTPAGGGTAPWSNPLIRRGAPILLIGLALVAAALVIMTVLGREDTGARPHRSPPAHRTTPTATPPPAPAEVTVPDGLVGNDVHDAAEILKEVGLKPETEAVESNEPKDVVVDTNPAEGASVPEESVVTLSVSQGPPPESDDGGDGPPGKAKGHDKGTGKE
jgi:tRNA A-37 threonylcarbamoyl transferase component Bud32